MANKPIWTRACSDKEAMDCCGSCKRLGYGKNVGKCTHHRIDGEYPPIWSVERCPDGRGLEAKQ